MPVEVDSSFWIPDPDSLGGDSTDTAVGCIWNQCTRQMHASGTMMIVAYVNGARKTASIHINVACAQIPDDSVANSSAVRKGVTKALHHANVDSATTKRQEVGGYIYQNTSTGLIFLVEIPSQSTICSDQEAPPPSIAQAVAIAHWHVHPFDSNTENIPGGGLCPHAPHGGTPLNGPTWPNDFPTDGYQSYIWEPQQFYITNANASRFSDYQTQLRVSGTCQRY